MKYKKHKPKAYVLVYTYTSDNLPWDVDVLPTQKACVEAYKEFTVCTTAKGSRIVFRRKKTAYGIEIRPVVDGKMFHEYGSILPYFP